MTESIAGLVRICNAIIQNMKDTSFWLLVLFTSTYLFWGGAYFLQDLNFEFIIYVAVIILIFTGVLLWSRHVNFPLWQLWLLSFWGLLHILGGAVQTGDGVLFAYRIYPFLDLGGEFYILKYDQVVHFYLYGVVALFAIHVLEKVLKAKGSFLVIALSVVLISVGVSVLNEIMEFIISINMENGVGGYENTMLDLIFNLSGAVLAVLLYRITGWKKAS